MLEVDFVACANVFSHEQDEEGVNEVSKYTKFSQLELTESQEVFSSWDRMTKRRSNCSQAEFKMWEQATGITYNEEAVLADTSLRPNLDPCKPYKHDWMHCLMSIGILWVSSICWKACNVGNNLVNMLASGQFHPIGSMQASRWQLCFQRAECKNTSRLKNSVALQVSYSQSCQCWCTS